MRSPTVVVLLLCAATAVLASDPWPVVGGNQAQTSSSSTVVGPASQSSVATNWTFQAGGSGPVVGANGLLYVVSGEGVLSALNASTGASVWSAELGERSQTSPALAPGSVIVGSDNYKLSSFDSTTGTLQWQFPTNGEIVAPAIVDSLGRVLSGCDDRNLYVINAADGSLLYQFEAGTDVSNGPAVGPDGSVYLTLMSSSGSVVGLTPKGSVAWKASLPAGAVPSGPSLSSAGVLYLTAFNSQPNVFAFNATTGVSLWTHSIVSEIEGGVALDNAGNVFVGANDTNVYCLDATTGNVKWSYSGAQGNVRATPVVDAANVLYFASDDLTVYAVHSLTGVPLWTQPIQGNAEWLGLGVTGSLFVGLFDGTLLSLS